MNKQVYDLLHSVKKQHFLWLKLKAKHDALESCLLPAAIRYDKDKVQSSPEDQTGRIVAEVVELETLMNYALMVKAEKIEEINTAISELESDEERTALTMRYIKGVPVWQIAKEMGYAESTIYKFLKKGADGIKCIRNINSDAV